VALKNTSFTPGVAMALTLFFLLTIVAVPLAQFAAEFSTVHSIRQLPTLVAFGSLVPYRHEVRKIGDVRRILPKPDEIKSVEKIVERDSVVVRWLLPRVESVLTRFLGAGNEQAYLGRNNWLFYRPDVDYVIGPPFLDPFWVKRRTLSADVHPHAVRAIVDFRDQLAKRAIDLVVVPTSVKPSVDGNMLALRSNGSLFENESFASFKAQLERAGIRVFDPEPLLTRRAEGARQPLYLQADTHWRPETMETVAQQLAYRVGVSRSASPFQIVDKKIKALGDIGRMLKLPPDQLAAYAQEITIHQVTAGNAVWRASKDADLLLLGDSFSNIFSLNALGWGESAGLAEHLSRALGRPIDCILRNSDGAFATREILSRDLARGRDRLAGKKFVVWEFATRELAFGNWKLLDMTLRQPPPARFFVPKAGEKINVTGTVESISTVPLPGSAPYSDHIMAVHLVDVSGTPRRENENVECLVYVWSMRDNVWTKSARLRSSDRISLTLQPWSDVSDQLEKINRSEIQDPDVQLEEPCWGELSE
jgi:alginate O-acetyltransferase complex protein AlgJ